ncbi:MAG: hypothetical protein M0017_03455 [Desulfobacteraceae bacterium]|nr:hypothetical protein [Desulfobacteraceae bacterium]
MPKTRIGIRVDSRIDERGEKAPRRLYIEGQPTDIAEVLDRWVAEDQICFKVLDGEGGLYIIRYDPRTGDWDLALMEQG